MIERQLNDVELRHDPERVRVASVLLVWSSCRLVFLSPYRPTHYPPFVPLLVPSHSCPSRVLYPVLFAFFSHSFHILFTFFSHSFRLLFANVHLVVCFSDDSFVRLIVQLFLCPGFYSQFVPIYTHSFICLDVLVKSSVCPPICLAER
jgi:hypothetical protein